MSYAFRCRNCNSLEEASAAGENAVPAKCRTCGAGVSFSPEGVKTYDPDNWIVLADLKKADLKDVLEYHAIDESEIERHTPSEPASPGHAPQSIAVSAEESSSSGDLTG